jgi:tRNA nucleotidyltransferase (CCA-adding enzyme)
MKDKNMAMAYRVAEEVDKAGGRTFFVGGIVRDRLMGVECKDIDIEVHGIPAKKLIEILDSIGEHTEMGASFGIYGLRHYEIDIAMPRSEKATGRGHKDFDVFTDPFLGEEKAARRRDFTINAMMENVLTGEIKDFFGGRSDLEKKILRHVDDASFVEDPLRVLRCAQFAARFSFSTDDKTVELCRKMDLSSLPKERIMGELEKALLKAEQPSIFFRLLEEMRQNDFWFEEYADLSERERAETDVFLDNAARLRENAKHPLYFMMSALCMYMRNTKSFVEKLSNETDMREYVDNICPLSKNVRALNTESESDEYWNVLFDKAVCPEDMLLLAYSTEAESVTEKSKEKLAQFKSLMAKPSVMGRDLIEAGLKPDKNFSKYLNFAHCLHLKGMEKAEALQMTLEYANKSNHNHP